LLAFPPGDRTTAKVRDWDVDATRKMFARLLKERTGEDVEDWNRRIREERFDDQATLRAWLKKQGVTGYAQDLLVWERFGYPDFLLATADELIDGQYADRPQLRPILDAVLRAASALGEVTIQARKTYVSLVSPRRTFARIQPTTKNRVDLGLRLQGVKRAGRLRPSTIQETMRVQIELTGRNQVDSEVRRWLKQAYDENR
jgi:Domain of unknown function (DUF5655)